MSNLSNTTTIYQEQIPTHLPSDFVEIAILGICFLIGAPLNLYAFYHTLTEYMNQTNVTRLLILKLHLNVADLMIIWVFALSEIIWMTAFQWHGGDLLCRVVKSLHNFSFFLTSNMIVCIAIDRVYTTFHMKDAVIKYKIHVRWLVYIAYSLALILSSPQLFIYRTYQPFPESPDWSQCVPIWTVYKYFGEEDQIVHWEKAYGWLHMLLVFWVPAAVVFMCYMLIIKKLKRTIRKDSATLGIEVNGVPLIQIDVPQSRSTGQLVPNCQTSSKLEYTPLNRSVPNFKNHRAVSLDEHSTESKSSQKQRRCASEHSPGRTKSHQPDSVNYAHLAIGTLTRAKKKTLKKATMIVAAYIVFWSPYNVIALINSIDNSLEILTDVAFLNCLIVVNAIVNPLIYGITL